MSAQDAARIRYAGMDAARGLAVAGMVLVHLVPAEGPGAWPALARAVEGKPAALFCLLAGMAWGVQAERAQGSPAFSTYVARRVAALLALGVAVHVLIWSTEVLVPLGLMMALSLWVRRGGRRALWIGAALLLASAPLAAAWVAPHLATDWLDDGGHVADRTVGWGTVRYLLADGNYPLVPWLAFPLVGMACLDGGLPFGSGPRRWFGWGLGVSCAASWGAGWAASHAARLGDWAAPLSVAWVPTTIPFALVSGGAAVWVAAGMAWREAARGLPSALGPVACLGRASLTHYLGHLVLVVAPLRLFWPDEDWPARVGIWALVGYLGAALPLSALWFRRHRRGPLEALLAWASGNARSEETEG